MRTIFVLLFAALSTGCAHPLPVELTAALKLVHEPLAQLAIGTQVEIPSYLRNVSSQPIEVCTHEEVVSAWLEGTATRFKWPIVIGGTVHGAHCATRQILNPGEEIAFISRGGISRNLPIGPATLHRAISVASSPYSSAVRIHAEESITLVSP